MPQYRKPNPKSQKEISNDQVDPYVNPETGETLGNPNNPKDYRQFTPESQKGINNSAENLSQRGDTYKDFSVNLKDVDEAVHYYFENVIKPHVIQSGKKVDVPLVYGSPERFKTIQKDGFLRDKNGKLMLPIAVFKRDNIDKNRSISKKLDANEPHLYTFWQKAYNQKNAYSNFDVLNNRKPTKQFVANVIPDYVTLTYSFTIQTYYVEQLNKIIEAINYASDSYWGDPERFKFRARIDSFATTTEISQGNKRAVKSTFTLKIHGYIVPDVLQKKTNSIKKYNDKSKVIFGIETVSSLPTSQTPPNIKSPSFINSTPPNIPNSIVRNSDGSYTISFPGGDTFTLPDEDIEVVDEDGNVLDTITNPVYDNVTIDLQSYCLPSEVTINTNEVTESIASDDSKNFNLLDSNGDAITVSGVVGDDVTLDVSPGSSCPIGAMPLKTGQTTSYRTGDDGDIQAGREVDFFTLDGNNPFGNTNRFTDELGGQTYTNEWVIDWSTYNGIDVLGYYRISQPANDWADAVDSAQSNFGGFSGCRLPNRNELNNIVNMESTRALNYPPFNDSSNNWFWSGSTYRFGSSQAFALQNQSGGVLAQRNRTISFYVFKPVRTFTVTGTTLT